MDFELLLVDLNGAVCAAWREYFSDWPEVAVIEGRFQDVPEIDCMVCSGNSFGIMDGGINLAIVRHIRGDLEEAIQARILDEYRGEQPVGTSMLVETGQARCPWVAHVPTMRVPMEISRTDNVYVATWALLLSLDRHNRTAPAKIQRVICPGLGTGAGHVPPGEAARQMALAYRHFIEPPTEIHWTFADERQAAVRYGGDKGFKIPPKG